MLKNLRIFAEKLNGEMFLVNRKGEPVSMLSEKKSYYSVQPNKASTEDKKK